MFVVKQTTHLAGPIVRAGDGLSALTAVWRHPVAPANYATRGDSRSLRTVRPHLRAQQPASRTEGQRRRPIRVVCGSKHLEGPARRGDCAESEQFFRYDVATRRLGKR